MASTTTTPTSRGAFFDMMLAAQPAAPAAAPTPARSAGTQSAGTQSAGNSAAFQTATARFPTARPLSVDENPTGVRGSSQTAPPKVEEVRNSPGTATLPLDTTPESAPPTVPVSDNPVDVINALLTRLGYDASTFQTRVTSSQISYPGASYEYPLLEVTVNGERVGFHLPSAMRDPRITAANISSMLGRPLLNFGVFA